jgi:hypothetical protein
VGRGEGENRGDTECRGMKGIAAIRFGGRIWLEAGAKVTRAESDLRRPSGVTAPLGAGTMFGSGGVGDRDDSERTGLSGECVRVGVDNSEKSGGCSSFLSVSSGGPTSCVTSSTVCTTSSQVLCELC